MAVWKAIAVVTVLVLMPAAAQGSHPSTESFVAGSGKLGDSATGEHHQVSAHRNDVGSDNEPKGYVRLTFPGHLGELQGHVTCLNVSGNQASVAFVVERARNSSANVGSVARIVIVDNPAGDRVSTGLGGNPDDCPLTGAFSPVVEGNFVVHQ